MIIKTWKEVVRRGLIGRGFFTELQGFLPWSLAVPTFPLLLTGNWHLNLRELSQPSPLHFRLGRPVFLGVDRLGRHFYMNLTSICRMPLLIGQCSGCQMCLWSPVQRQANCIEFTRAASLNCRLLPRPPLQVRRTSLRECMKLNFHAFRWYVIGFFFLLIN